MITSEEERRHSYNQVVAGYYDAVYSSVPNLGPDKDFYVGLATELGGPVLELGCGTGRVLLEIAQRGLPCWGLDASASMLDLLRAKPGSTDLSLVHSQMQHFDLGTQRFAFVYSAFRAFQHMYTPEDQLGCLQSVLRHLQPGGQFAFDVFAPKLERMAQAREAEVQDFRFRVEGDMVFRYVSVERDHTHQMQRLDMRFERRRDSQVISTEHEKIYMRWFHRYELEHLLYRAGFARVELFGDFDCSPITADSPAFLVVGTAPA